MAPRNFIFRGFLSRSAPRTLRDRPPSKVRGARFPRRIKHLRCTANSNRFSSDFRSSRCKKSREKPTFAAPRTLLSDRSWCMKFVFFLGDFVAFRVVWGCPSPPLGGRGGGQPTPACQPDGSAATLGTVTSPQGERSPARKRRRGCRSDRRRARRRQPSFERIGLLDFQIRKQSPSQKTIPKDFMHITTLGMFVEDRKDICSGSRPRLRSTSRRSNDFSPLTNIGPTTYNSC